MYKYRYYNIKVKYFFLLMHVVIILRIICKDKDYLILTVKNIYYFYIDLYLYKILITIDYLIFMRS